MLKSLSIFIILAVASAEDVLQDEDDLKFHVVTDRNIEIPPTIQVRFSNGEQDDLVLKHYRINEQTEVGCNYLGHLKNDPYSSVAVTGCLNAPEDKLEITMVSDNYLKTVSVDFQGNTQKIKNPYEENNLHTTLRNDKEWNQSNDEIINDNLEKQAQNAKISAIPSKLRATIKFGYEDTMKEWLGSQDFDSWIQAPLVHAQAIYKHRSLGTEIEFEVVGNAIYQNGARWVPIEDAPYSSWYAAIAATQASMLNEPAVVYSWWCSGDKWGGAVGALGALCQDNNINLNMRIDGALKNGMILAHELGHNFGMLHDWDDNLGGVGGPCDGDGLMSYGYFDQPLRWSSCSRTSFEQHYSGLNWGCNCLLDISEDSEGQNHCDNEDGVENKGTDCWSQCRGRQGPCPQFCGKGLCCKYGWEDKSGGCDGSIGVPGKGHVCSADPNYVEEENQCPDSHPYAYYDGHYCCASDYEKIYEPQGTKCDGGKIQYDSMCCGSDDYIPCPSGICSNTGNGDEIDLCGHSCQSVIAMSAPCSTTWEMGCGTIDPPEGFTSNSTLYELCPNECPGDEGNEGGIDLCGYSCESAIAMSAPCTSTWEQGCGAIDPPEGFTSQSTLYELCPNECPGQNEPGNNAPGQNEPECEDMLSSKRCEKRKASGKCSKKGIQKKCQKTCGLCG